MLNIFKRKKINIDSISIPDFGWSIDKMDNSIKQWTNPQQAAMLSVNFFNKKPDLPTLKDVTTLRNLYRKRISSNNGGLIQVDIIELQGYPTLKSIFKFPQEPMGMAYLSSFIIPFENYSYVVKIQASEKGISGMRDNAIAMKLLNDKKITLGDNGYEGWFNDPYDPQITEGVLMNKSENELYDTDFPNHPLSIIRELQKKIELEIKFGAELKKIEKFKK